MAREGALRCRSAFKKKYITDFESNAMKKEFSNFLEELDEKWRQTKHFPICHKLQRKYYEDVEEEGEGGEGEEKGNEMGWSV